MKRRFGRRIMGNFGNLFLQDATPSIIARFLQENQGNLKKA